MAELRVATTSRADTLVQESSVVEFTASVRSAVLRPGADGYEAARTVYNAMIDRRPALIARCAGGADVILIRPDVVAKEDGQWLIAGLDLMVPALSAVRMLPEHGGPPQPCRTFGNTSSASMCSSSHTRLCGMPGHCTLMIK